MNLKLNRQQRIIYQVKQENLIILKLLMLIGNQNILIRNMIIWIKKLIVMIKDMISNIQVLIKNNILLIKSLKKWIEPVNQ